MKAEAQIDALVSAALEMQEHADLTMDQRFKAQQIYSLASSLESDLQADECEHIRFAGPSGKFCTACGVKL
jgi:hypothetical protein